MKKKKTDSKKKPIRSFKEKASKPIQPNKTNAKVKTALPLKKINNSFHIVAMCASAGGLEAVEQFLKNMPSDIGMAFILVPHLDPTHKSLMADLIKRCTNMEVLEAKDGMQVLPNSIYVIPPNSDLAIFNGDLQLLEPAARKFFKRKEVAFSAYPATDIPTAFHTDANRQVEKIAAGDKDHVFKLSDLIEQMLLDKYAPPCVIINQKFDILFINGRTGKYLEPASGEAKMNVLDMAREGLKQHLQFGIRKCLSSSSEVVVKQVQVRGNGSYQMINLIVKPVHFPGHKESLMMVLFEDCLCRMTKRAGRKLRVIGTTKSAWGG